MFFFLEKLNDDQKKKKSAFGERLFYCNNLKTL